MSYIDQNLGSGETVLYRTRLHWIAMLTHFMVAVVVSLVGIALLINAVSGTERKSGNSLQLVAVGLTLLMLAALVVATAFWKRSATEMAVTNRRVLVKIGLLTRRSTEIMLLTKACSGACSASVPSWCAASAARRSHLPGLPIRWSSAVRCRSKLMRSGKAARQRQVADLGIG